MTSGERCPECGRDGSYCWGYDLIECRESRARQRWACVVLGMIGVAVRVGISEEMASQWLMEADARKEVEHLLAERSRLRAALEDVMAQVTAALGGEK